mmetsp:Transcript_121942/g.306843  ORF Transcript_121942/g.306843 Transcript_121942/m.306843 type:complete len:231 (-) Transcript_121942:202-894(-)
MRGGRCAWSRRQASASSLARPSKGEAPGQRGGASSPEVSCARMAASVKPWSGSCPVTMKWSRRPKQKTSALLSGWPAFLKTSGAIQRRVPPKGSTRPVSNRESPKSSNLGWTDVPCTSTFTLSLFTSPCTTTGKRLCRYQRAQATPTMTAYLCATSGPGALDTKRVRFGPVTISSTRPSCRSPTSITAPWSCTRFGCRARRRTRSSLARLGSMCTVSRSIRGSFTATSSP